MALKTPAEQTLPGARKLHQVDLDTYYGASMDNSTDNQPADSEDSESLLPSHETAETSTPKADDKPLMSDRDIAATNAAMVLESNERKELVFAPWFLGSMSLPNRDPGEDVGVWERVNGTKRIQIVPSYVDGKFLHPYGVTPRLILIWLCTQATQNKSPVIEISASLNAFLGDLALHGGGRQRAEVMEQLRRLISAGIRISEITNDGKVQTEIWTNLFIFTRSKMLFSSHSHTSDDPMWGSTVTLSEEFYQQVKGHSFPLPLEALRACSGSTLIADAYMFLVYRLHGMHSPARISWDQLAKQFGSNYARTRDFKLNFQKALKVALIMYPEAKVKAEKKFLVLYPSDPHVAKESVKS